MLDRVLKTVSTVRLTGGLVGRLCTVLIVVCVCLAALGVASRSEYLTGVAIVAILVIALPLMWRLVAFAEANPNVAILDGSEFVRAESARMKHAAKYMGTIETANRTAGPALLENAVQYEPPLDAADDPEEQP